MAVGRWTVDHQNSSGSLNLRERTDSYNKTLQPRAEVKDYGNHVHYAWHDDGSQPCVQSPLNGTQPPWTIDPAALLIANRSATGEAVEVWRALYASISQCVDFYIRGSYPAGTLETLPYTPVLGQLHERERARGGRGARAEQLVHQLQRRRPARLALRARRAVPARAAAAASAGARAPVAAR